MIRQPDFVTEAYAEYTIDKIKREKPAEQLDEVQFKTIDDGLCVHMMHIGSYDAEAASFDKMEAYCEESGLRRSERLHEKSIFLTPAEQPRKT